MKLHLRRWTPDDVERPRFTVLGVHGLGEHSGRYQHVAAAAAARGGEFIMFDLPGHGKSEGKRGHIEQFLDYLADVALLHQILYEDEGKLTVFVLGHSLGGLIAARYAQENPDHIKGLIISGAALKIAQPIPGWQAALGRFLSKIAPGLTMSNNIDPGLLSTDPATCEAYKADPLVHRRVSARLFTELVKELDRAHVQAQTMRLPVLIMHGADDTLTDPDGSRNFCDECGSQDKTLKLYEGCYHEIFNERIKETVLTETFDWVEQHL